MAKVGRKPKGPYIDKGSVFSARIRSDTRRDIEKAARKSGRSLAQEIEHRLRRSFEDDRTISRRFGSRETYAVARLIGLAVEIENGPHSRAWLHETHAFDQTYAAIKALLDQLRPVPSINRPRVTKPLSTEVGLSWQRAFESIRESSGLHVASMITAELRGAPFGLPLVRPAESRAKKIEHWKAAISSIRNDLGALTERFSAEAIRDEMFEQESAAGQQFDDRLNQRKAKVASARRRK